jgi:hypothetical protein
MRANKMNKVIVVEVKTVYGKDLLYPTMPELQILTGNKTISMNQLNVFRMLGHDIELQAYGRTIEFIPAVSTGSQICNIH